MIGRSHTFRAKVKKVVNDCNTCKVFRVKPYGNTVTADMPKFRTEAGKPFETTGIDFAGPLHCKVSKKEQGTCYILIFTCATTRAVHLEVTNTHSAEEFQRKLNAFITRRTRPRLIISDNAKEFKATASWIQKIQRSEALQDHLARQQIKWQFNLARSPWWGGMYERLIRDIKKALYKTLGKSTLVFSQLEVVVMDIERQLNNRPLTYVESDGGDGRVLTPNVVMWGENAHTLEDTEVDEDVLIRADKQLKLKRQHAWRRWGSEYIHSLMEQHRVNRKPADYPDVGEVVLVVGDERNKAQWRRRKSCDMCEAETESCEGW